ncbi:MAG: hypothetical protein APF84_19500 [Gracilibacter sp. BRH_c7a]|nr:MAG: hypothetical protein APF84_19500 [Gracilibacter sp. BRH_c7a]
MLKGKRKNMVIVALSILLIISIVYSANKKVLSSSGALEEELTICTSSYPIYIMALNVTANVPNIRLVSVTSPESGCIHDAQLSVSDMKILDQSDVFIINGAGMEGYLEKVVDSFSDLLIIDASKDLNLNQDQHQEGEEHSNHNDEVNPHVWVSITMAMQQARSIGEELAVIDQANKGLYLKNTSYYLTKLEELRASMHQELADFENRNIITIHDAFPYFAQEFNLNILAVVQRESDSEPSAKELAETIRLIKENNVRGIFVEPQFSDLAAQTIARETGAKVYALDPASSGPLHPDAYLDIMKKNLQTLKEALAE